MIREACVGSYIEGMSAWKKGTDRIELCDNLTEGGTTPSYGTVKKLVEDVDIPVVVIIRPRGGDFVYSSEEIEVMLEDIRILKALDIEGFVLGVLDRGGSIDYAILERLLKECEGYRVTFHKAIDEIEDPAGEVARLADLGVARILTSGGEATALEGADVLNRMIDEAKGRIEIIVAGRVTEENISEVSSKIKAGEFHGKLIVGAL